MAEKMRCRIEYLDINDDFYVENDELKMKVHDGAEPKSGTWEELWLGVRDIMEKIFDYVEEHNQGLRQ